MAPNRDGSIPDTQASSFLEQENLPAEAAFTVHRVVEAFDTDKKSIGFLHRDLFDSRTKVVLSAIAALGRLGDQRSFRFIARLLTHRDEAIQTAAARAVGEITHPSAKRILLDLFKASGSEQLRRAALESLARIEIDDQQVAALIREYAGSLFVTPETRALARSILLESRDVSAVKQMLSDPKNEVVDQVYSAALTSNALAPPVLQHGIPNFHRLSAKNRGTLVSIASTCAESGCGGLFLEALRDLDPAVRGKAYSLLDGQPGLIGRFDDILQILSEGAEMLPALEDEVLRAVDRLEAVVRSGLGLPVKTRESISACITDLYRQLKITDRRVSSDSHELGWLIMRSKEYMEYYVEEDLRQSILQLLKGSSNYSSQELLQALRNSAVRVEVRHFEGYSALADIIKKPDRPGKALIARELTLAKLGKRTLLIRLIRNLRMARLFLHPGGSQKISVTIEEIYTWAKEAKLYRLAEAALFALARIDSRKTTQACRECLTPPVLSKVLAIAAMHLLVELDWQVMESSVIELINGSEDAYILLNLIDALSAAKFTVSAECIKTLIETLEVSRNREVISRISEFLGENAGFSSFRMLKEIFNQKVEWKQDAVLSVMDRMISRRKVVNRDELSEFLYQILRQGSTGSSTRAAVLLWKLRDDYAPKILKRLLGRGDLEERLRVLNYVKTDVGTDLVPVLGPLLGSDDIRIQEALRETLLSAGDRDTQNKILEMVLAAREDMKAAADEKAEASEINVDFFEQKKAYRFEKEHVQRLAILFTDIQEYSKKAQLLSTMELASLLQEYEGILLPVIHSHRGELIKTMGDGHLFVFRSPLHAVLAAVRMQKSLKRFNSYREENSRIIIRIGIHWGKVVRKQGDVLGNHVNIAARLESAARGGGILVSQALHDQLDGYIHCREIGLITVKGIAEAIRVYEPFETVLDLPPELDPLKSEQTLSPGEKKQGIKKHPGQRRKRKRLSIDQEVLEYIAATFSRLNGLCRQAEAREIEVAAIRSELTKRWRALSSRLKAGMSE
jgi:class 3 adenylate cyclase